MYCSWPEEAFLVLVVLGLAMAAVVVLATAVDAEAISRHNSPCPEGYLAPSVLAP